MARPHSDEKNLVKRAVNGDTEAFGTLYLHYLDAIFRYIFFRVNTNEEAEDLTEMVFLKAWEALPEYRSFGFPFSSWLYRIAHNVVIDHHRKMKNIPIDLVDTQEPQSLSGESKSLLTQVISKEEITLLTKAVQMLPEDQQQIIVLRFVEGLSHKEIAKIIEKKEGACRMLQHRALVALNRLLNEG